LVEAVEAGDPVIFLEHRSLYDVPAEEEDGLASPPVLSGRVVQQGNAATIVAWGAMQRVARQATQALVQEGLFVDLIDPVTVKPMNHRLIHDSVARTSRLLVVDEGPRTGSVAAEIIIRALEDAPRPPQAFRRLTFPDVHHPFDPRLEAALLPSKDAVVASVKTLVGHRSRQDQPTV
jgi:pyruvate/2-oxoglutarate/acetoin dehydrogenase E1 component